MSKLSSGVVQEFITTKENYIGKFEEKIALILWRQWRHWLP
jgi:hypothetical protein